MYIPKQNNPCLTHFDFENSLRLSPKVAWLCQRGPPYFDYDYEQKYERKGLNNGHNKNVTGFSFIIIIYWNIKSFYLQTKTMKHFIWDLPTFIRCLHRYYLRTHCNHCYIKKIKIINVSEFQGNFNMLSTSKFYIIFREGSHNPIC